MKRALLTAFWIALAAPAFAQPYPSRTVSVVVPFPAGGSVDVVARLLVQKLAESLALTADQAARIVGFDIEQNTAVHDVFFHRGFESHQLEQLFQNGFGLGWHSLIWFR